MVAYLKFRGDVPAHCSFLLPPPPLSGCAVLSLIRCLGFRCPAFACLDTTPGAGGALGYPVVDEREGLAGRRRGEHDH